MSSRKKAKPQKINISEDERKKWKRLLVDYYKPMPIMPNSFQKFKAEHSDWDISHEEFIDRYINYIIQTCEDGWERAPKSFEKRISYKSGWNNPIRFKKSSKIITKEEGEDHNSYSMMDFKSILSDDEKEFYTQRLKQYFDDFEFNDSSDKPLVERLIIEEVVYRRLMILQLRQTSGKKIRELDANADIATQLSDSHKRMSELQKQLGISRMQRADEINKGANSVAEMAMMLDEKLKKYPELRGKLEEEEQKYVAKKKEQVPINFIPEREQLENMLAQTDSTQIYENIVGEMLDLPKEENKKQELAEGVTVDRNG